MLLIITSIGWLIKFTLTNLHCNLDSADLESAFYSISAGETLSIPLTIIKSRDSCREDCVKVKLLVGKDDQSDDVGNLFSFNEDKSAVLVNSTFSDIGQYEVSVKMCQTTGKKICKSGKGAKVEILGENLWISPW